MGSFNYQLLSRSEVDSFWHHDFQDALESGLHGLGKQTSLLGHIIFVKKVMFFVTVFVCKNNNTVLYYFVTITQKNKHCMVWLFLFLPFGGGEEGVVKFWSSDI